MSIVYKQLVFYIKGSGWLPVATYLFMFIVIHVYFIYVMYLYL